MELERTKGAHIHSLPFTDEESVTQSRQNSCMVQKSALPIDCTLSQPCHDVHPGSRLKRESKGKQEKGCPFSHDPWPSVGFNWRCGIHSGKSPGHTVPKERMCAGRRWDHQRPCRSGRVAFLPWFNTEFFVWGSGTAMFPRARLLELPPLGTWTA